MYMTLQAGDDIFGWAFLGVLRLFPPGAFAEVVDLRLGIRGSEVTRVDIEITINLQFAQKGASLGRKGYVCGQGSCAGKSWNRAMNKKAEKILNTAMLDGEV